MAVGTVVPIPLFVAPAFATFKQWVRLVSKSEAAIWHCFDVSRGRCIFNTFPVHKKGVD